MSAACLRRTSLTHTSMPFITAPLHQREYILTFLLLLFIGVLLTPEPQLWLWCCCHFSSYSPGVNCTYITDQSITKLQQKWNSMHVCRLPAASLHARVQRAGTQLRSSAPTEKNCWINGSIFPFSTKKNDNTIIVIQKKKLKPMQNMFIFGISYPQFAGKNNKKKPSVSTQYCGNNI